MARTAATALREYLAPLQAAVTCVSPTVLIHNCQRPWNRPTYFATFPGNAPCRVRTTSGHLLLTVNSRFLIVQGADGSRAITRKYSYALSEEDGREIIAFHSHPGEEGFDQPHVHVSAGAGRVRQELQHAHIPTRLLTLAEVVEFAIRDFGVVPMRDNHALVLWRASQTGQSALLG